MASKKLRKPRKSPAKSAAASGDPPAAPPPSASPEVVKLADYINPRVLDAAQMVMVVTAALEPKPGVPAALGDEARAGLVRILQEVTEIILSIKSKVASAVHGPTAPGS
jgi:hypothetical protein